MSYSNDSSKSGFFMGLLLLLAVALFATTPTFSDHRNAINDDFKQKNQVAGWLKIGQLIGELTTYQNHVFFSTTYIEQELVAVGVMNNVFVVSDLQF